MMRASLIIVTYNSRAYIEACLDAALAELEAQDELIVVDNDSSDGSADLVSAWYPQVRLLRGANVGYAAGNNAGAAVARGASLVFLNPDTVMQPGALEALLAPLEQPGDVALTTACIVHMSQPGVINACGNTMHYTGLTYCRGAGRVRAQYAAPCEVDAVSGAAFAIRRAVFADLGGFDEQFFLYVEDSDLSLRARLAGHRVGYVPEAIIKHDYHMNYSPTKAYYVDRNRHLMLLKNLSQGTYARLLPGLLLSELITWGFLLLKGVRYWGVKPKVYRWLWEQRGKLAAARRSQPTNRVHDLDIVGQLTYRLEFGQLAGRTSADLAALLVHPAFWAARLLLARGRA